ncbi:MAG TPA: glycosyltransferase family 2 protein [Anaerolineaceae bacterium]|nr:glycosyltransferase family 2 protein [Anaerolineaceae bacterium]
MNKLPDKSISIVVPVYNSEGSLTALVDEVKAVLEPLDIRFEMILVNDGSRDKSWQVIEKLVAENAGRVCGVKLMRNYGQHNALLCGIRAAKNEICVTMDDDLQHPASAIPQILAKLDEGFDVVYATPNEETHGFFRDMASVITKLALANTMNSESARNVSAFRGFRTNVRDAFAAFNGSNVAIDVLLSWATTKFGVIKVPHRPRTIGKSNYSFKALLQHATNMMTGYSTLPLRISSGIGFLFTLFGVGVFLYTLIRYLLYGGLVPGFTFTASLIAIFSGAQLFALGILGEYIARMHYRLMDKPSYTVESKEGFDD